MVEVDRVQSWFAWLKSCYPTKQPPSLVIAPPEYDSIGDVDGNPIAFAVFIPDRNQIITLSNVMDVLDDEEERCLFTSLAHEYKHHLQWIDGARAFNEFDEEPADSFADAAYQEFKKNERFVT